ncbi:MAG TPA: PilN domain-containing protein [Kofleriaceae bacterium]|nr:PilN domain-containing protein [Kofleriaceae bacterium]
MIRINLLPHKRAKGRFAGASASEPSTRDILIGTGALVGAALLLFILVDQPKRSRLHDLEESNEQLQQQINDKNEQLKGKGNDDPGYETLKKLVEESDKRAQSIIRLMSAKVVPANVLHELSEIMTTSHPPTMTDEMAKKVARDPNKRFDVAWDPTKVWLMSFSDKADDGTFKLEGGAQAEADIVQLSKRLQASAYFDRVSLQTEERVSDRDTGITYYRFVITGKVAY